MFPSHYVCTSCRERFEFSQHEARYYFGDALLGNPVPWSELHEVPVRPAWCKACASICLVEDIAPVRDFEHAYGAARAGRPVEYPTHTEYLSPEHAQAEMAAYLRWRMARRHPARALCCGGVRFQFLDVAQPLFKHADCEFGVIEPGTFHIGSHNGPGPGIYSAANTRVYNGEGDLIGLMTWRDRDTDTWTVEPAAYPAPESED